jgi:hypothetical protein
MYLRSILLKILVSIILLFIVSYGAYKLYPIVSGPKIEIISPQKGEVVATNIIKIKGRVLRAKEVKIYDREISLDPNGYFEENVVRQDLFTNIVISAKDKYGRVKIEKYFVQ